VLGWLKTAVLVAMGAHVPLTLHSVGELMGGFYVPTLFLLSTTTWGILRLMWAVYAPIMAARMSRVTAKTRGPRGRREKLAVCTEGEGEGGASASGRGEGERSDAPNVRVVYTGTPGPADGSTCAGAGKVHPLEGFEERTRRKGKPGRTPAGSGEFKVGAPAKGRAPSPEISWMPSGRPSQSGSRKSAVSPPFLSQHESAGAKPPPAVSRSRRGSQSRASPPFLSQASSGGGSQEERIVQVRQGLPLA